MASTLDERTQKYFDAIKNNIGYVGKNGGELTGIEEILKKHGDLESANLTKVTSYDRPSAMSSEIDVYKYRKDGKDRYSVEWTTQYDIDGFGTTILIFDKLPKPKDIETISKVESIEFDMKYKGLQAEFRCWECGSNSHWLDGDKDFIQKADNLYEKYCGC